MANQYRQAVGRRQQQTVQESELNVAGQQRRSRNRGQEGDLNERSREREVSVRGCGKSGYASCGRNTAGKDPEEN